MRADRRGGRHRKHRGRARAAAALLLAALIPLLVGIAVIDSAAAAPGHAGASADSGAGGRAQAGPQLAAVTGSASATGPGASTLQADPAYPYVGYLKPTIADITPTVVTAASGDVMTVTGTVTNASKGTLYDLRYVWQRGDPLVTLKAVKAEIAAPSRPSVVVGQNWKVLAAKPVTAGQTDLAAGASMEFVATVGISDADGLALRQGGVYPLMIKVSGDVGQNGQIQYERVGEIHLLATVLSVPSATAAQGRPSTITPAPPAVTQSSGSPSGTLETTPAAGNSGIAIDTTTDIPTQGFPSTATSSAGPSRSAADSTTNATTGSVATTARTGDGTNPTAAADSGAGPGTPGAHPVALNLLWPLVDSPHIGVGGVFLDDRLANEIAPTGRLGVILTNLIALNTGASSTTIVVDPELLDEVVQMSDGYRVVATPGVPQPALTPATSAPATTTSTTTTAHTSTSGAITSTAPRPTQPVTGKRTDNPTTNRTSAAVTDKATTTSEPSTLAPLIAGTVAGKGQQAAIAFLKEFQEATAGQHVLVLPYSDPDSVALIRAGLSTKLARLITMGRSIIARVVAADVAPPELITDVSLPAGGAVNDATLAFLSSHGMSHALLSPTTLERVGRAAGSVAIDESANSGHEVTAAVTDAEVLPQVLDLVTRGNSAGVAVRLNNLAAVLTGGSMDGTGTPLIISPDKRWTVNAVGLGLLSGLLRTLQSGGVFAGQPLAGIAAAAKVPAVLNYPDSAQQAELDPGYLADVLQTSGWISGMQASLARSKGDQTANPADILVPLSQAMTSLGSAAFRTDKRVGSSILSTATNSLGGLRAGVVIAGGCAGTGPATTATGDCSASYTLASSSSPLLINVRNDLPYVATVRVMVIGGDAVGLSATDPGAQSIPAGRSQQFKIVTKVAKAGRFPLDVQLIAADGSVWSAPTTITVSSSAYGTLTLVLIAGAGGALFLMVAIRLVQRVRNRNGPGCAAPGEGADTEPEHPEPGPPERDSVLGAANAPPGQATGSATGGADRNPAAADASSDEATGTPPGNEARPEHRPDTDRNGVAHHEQREGER